MMAWSMPGRLSGWGLGCHDRVAVARRILDDESPVKVWREKRGLSQRKLAELAGVSPSYLAEIETGKRPGSADALRKLSRALAIPMENLVSRPG